MRKVPILLAFGLLVACSETRTVASENLSSVPICVEQPFRAALHVDANDPRSVWATNYDTGRDVVVRARPPGRFTFDRSRPTTLLDGEGNLVSFDGEISRTGCFDATRQVVYIGAQDLPDPNRPAG